jgi:DNA-binding HxlR family transcriptional regulator
MKALFLDSFSGAAANLPRGKRDDINVLGALAKSPRVSVWDMCEYAWLRGRVNSLLRAGLITEDKSEPYPWHRYLLTDKGREMLKGGATV